MSEYDVYTSVATAAVYWELPHDRIRNGIVIHSVPRDSATANALINTARVRIHKQGYKMNTRWLDEWTLRINWSK